jgi:hypothetical protein
MATGHHLFFSHYTEEPGWRHRPLYCVPQLGGRPKKIVQKLKGSGIGVMQVVQHQQHGPVIADGIEDATEGREEVGARSFHAGLG